MLYIAQSFYTLPNISEQSFNVKMHLHKISRFRESLTGLDY